MTTLPTGRASTRQVSAQVVRLMRQLGSLKAQAAAHSRHGVEWSAFALLLHLINEGPMRSSTLAERLAADPSTVSRQAASLVDAGLVERRPDPADRRAVQLAVTELGSEVFHRMREDRAAMFDAVLADWSDADVEQLTALLSRFTNDLEQRRPQLLKTLSTQESR